MEAVLAVPPAAPEEMEVNQTSSSTVNFQWQPNREFDLSHYRIEYGASPDDLSESETTSDTFYEFIRANSTFPDATRIYFRIQAVDKEGNSGEFSQLFMVEFG